MHRIDTLEQLETHYDAPGATSLAKVSQTLTPQYAQMLEASPFCLIASEGPEGLDCSPRGDEKSCIHVIDNKTLALPDRRGNNRIDTLRNIVRTGRIAVCALIPGVNETIRINGTAILSTDPTLLETYQQNGKPPTTVIVITINELYFQCARALMRSDLWNSDLHRLREDLPRAGEMTRSVVSSFDADSYDKALLERQKKTLY